MSLRETLLRPALQSLSSRGPTATARSLLQRLGLPIAADPLDPYPHNGPLSIHPFDQRHSVDTSGYVPGEKLHTSPSQPTPLHGSALWSTAYYPIAPSLFDQALRLLATALHQPSSPLAGASASPTHPSSAPAWSPFTPFTFLDLGCGKGRALLLASRHPFQRILGVELDPTLAATAQRNLLTFRDPAQICHNLQVVQADAAGPALFDQLLTPTVLFLYHPFLAPVLRRVLLHLTQSLARHPRPLWLVYCNPEPIAVLREFPTLREHTRTLLHITPEDDLPDRLGVRTEEFALFQHKQHKP